MTTKTHSIYCCVASRCLVGTGSVVGHKTFLLLCSSLYWNSRFSICQFFSERKTNTVWSCVHMDFWQLRPCYYSDVFLHNRFSQKIVSASFTGLLVGVSCLMFSCMFMRFIFLLLPAVTAWIFIFISVWACFCGCLPVCHYGKVIYCGLNYYKSSFAFLGTCIYLWAVFVSKRGHYNCPTLQVAQTCNIFNKCCALRTQRHQEYADWQ